MPNRKKKRRKKERFSEKLFRYRLPLVTILALVVGGALIGVSYWHSSSQLTPFATSDEDELSPTTAGATEQPTKGYLDAPVTIVEFSEFYCPYCARFTWEILPKIVEEYVKKDLVKIVFRNFPVHGEPAVLGEHRGGHR